jgi:VWFA-related protein
MKALLDSRRIIGFVVLVFLALGADAQRGTPPPRSTGVSQPRMPSAAMGSVSSTPGSLLNNRPRYPKVDKRTVTFKSESQLVLVPVVVQNRRGEHLSGLDKDLFTLYENGKQRRVTIFEEIKKASGRIQRPVLPAGVYTNLVTKETAPRQLTIVMLDMLNTPLPDQARARDELTKYLARTVDENTPTALLVLSRKGVRLLYDFTSDPRLLAAALKQASGEQPVSHTPIATAPSVTESAMLSQGQADGRAIVGALDAATAGPSSEYQQAAAIAATMEAFQHLAQSFAGVPGRKALIWATASFPFSVTDDTGIVGQGQPSSLYERTMQMLNNANIAVYPVDVRGLVVFGGAGDYSEVSHSATLGTMEMFAEMTGGRAFFNRNDLHKSFAEATQESASYYLLGYQLDTSDKRSGWRKLKVEVSQSGVRVRARSGFFVTPVTEDPDYSRQVDIYNALQSPLDYTSLPFVVRWLEIKESGGTTKATFEIVLAAGSVEIDADDKNRIELEFVGVARDMRGEPAGEFTQTFSSRLKPEALAQIQQNGITYKYTFEMPRGEYRVRFVVRDNNSGRTGSVLAELPGTRAASK